MTYDPFATDDTPHTSRRLTHARKPRLFSKRLHALEWNPAGNTTSSAGDVRSNRKRPRPAERPANGNNNNSNMHDVNAADGSEHGRATNHSSRRPSPPPSQSAAAVSVSARPPSTPNVPPPASAVSLTILGEPPLVDDRVRSVAQFMLAHVKSGDVEIEAKLGTVMEKADGGRNRASNTLPLSCETLLGAHANSAVRFVSDVGPGVFQHLNKLLCTRCERDPNVSYDRTCNLDTYWQDTASRTKIRETHRYNANTGQFDNPIGIMTKIREGDLNVLCPLAPLDTRYSASTERRLNGLPPTVSNTHVSKRQKDRISFKYDYVQVDLTCVTSEEKGEQKETREIEVEIADSQALFDHVTRYHNADTSSKIFDIAASLVNTVRALLEEARKFTNQMADETTAPNA